MHGDGSQAGPDLVERNFMPLLIEQLGENGDGAEHDNVPDVLFNSHADGLHAPFGLAFQGYAFVRVTGLCFSFALSKWAIQSEPRFSYA